MKEFLQLEKSAAHFAQSKVLVNCPQTEALEDVAEHGRKSKSHAIVMDHIAECSNCFKLFRDLRKVESLRPAKAFWSEKFANWLGNCDSPSEGSTSIPATVATLVTGALARPTVAGSYRRAGITRKAVELTTPLAANASLPSLPESIEWLPVEGADGYEIRLEECLDPVCRQYREIPDAYSIVDCRAELDIEVIRFDSGRYRIVIRPDTDSGFTLEPAESVYQFDILDAADSRAARWALDHSGSAPVAAALSLYELRMFGDAATIAATWPDDANLNEIRESILSTAEHQRQIAGAG